MRSRSLAALAVAAAGLAGIPALTGANASAGSAAPADADTEVYIVELAASPVAEYGGGIAGLEATEVTPGERLDKATPAVREYVTYLNEKRADVRARVGATSLYDYNYTYAGFAAELTATEAARLERSGDVLSVERSETVQGDTISTPRFLGLTGEGGVWDKVGGIDKAGDGVIIGVIDSGFVPERPSFAPIETTWRSDQIVAAKWKGKCDPGTEAPLVTCNNKVIGARYFDKGILAGAGAKPIPEEYVSPRDRGGHGTHTASTAAGNNGVLMKVQGRDWGLGSGIAPQARLAIYKGLWDIDNSGGGSGNSADLVAAIDAATADGVDVINYSISSAELTTTGAIGQAFLRAGKAGVFVATSAGNTGPGASTVRKHWPWVTTVANGTHDRAISQSVTLGNGATYTGGGIGGASPNAPLVLATSVKLAAATDENASLCLANTLDPAKAVGKIVLCERRLGARVDKSLQIKNAGGVGMILWNAAASTIESERHSVPTVHVDHVVGAAIREYAATADATAAIAAAEVSRAQAPKVASTSSRGPAPDADLLKPDVMAPGTGVLAATVSDRDGEEYAFFSGTSMSSPHVAGIAAILIGRHPAWSPMAVKSAILTTATTTDNDGKAIEKDSGGASDPFGYGAGQVRPRLSLDPGLVYDSTYTDWTRYICGAGHVPSTHELCANGKIDPSDLNYPTIAVGELAGKQTITRTVTNVSSKTETYRASVEGLAGIDAQVSPQSFELRPGRSKTFTVTFTNQTAAPNAYAFGKLVWKGRKHSVASVIAVKPVLMAGPASVTGTGTSGSAELSVTPGINGDLSTTVSGLVASTQHNATLRNAVGGTFPATNPAANDHVAKFTIDVPAGTRALKLATYAGEHGAVDVDVHVYAKDSKTRLFVSAADGADETIVIRGPGASYDVYVDLWAGAGDQPITLHSWLAGAGSGNLTVTPNPLSATVGQPATLTAAWSGLESGKRYFGLLDHSGAGARANGATVDITTN
ncbi:S8 family serine peptidase [Nocardioides speluncae]|uniref:S8 family serine peptidase n=1 Tax=Nocardioides speluncae TaxID=2670337 RepID=UPI000D68E0D3|nr:S8 family serine peptidase [Nocardioides speluncae]